MFIFHDLFDIKKSKNIQFEQVNKICMQFFVRRRLKIQRKLKWFVERRKRNVWLQLAIQIHVICVGILLVSQFDGMKLLCLKHFVIYAKQLFGYGIPTMPFIAIESFGIGYMPAVPIIRNDSSELTSCHNIHAKIQITTNARLLCGKANKYLLPWFCFI